MLEMAAQAGEVAKMRTNIKNRVTLFASREVELRKSIDLRAGGWFTIEPR